MTVTVSSLREYRPHEGFSLVELVMVSGLSLILLGLAYSGFVSGTSRSMKVDLEQQSVSALERLAHRLTADLRQARPAGNRHPELRAELQASLPRPDLRFLTVDPGGKETTVAYRFDPRAGRLLRDGEPLADLSFENVTFRVLRGPGDETLELAVTCAGGSALGGPGTAEAARRVFTVLLPLDPPLLEPILPWFRVGAPG